MNKNWLFALENRVNKLLKDVIMHDLSLAARMVNVIPQQNKSVLQNGITRNSQSSKKNIETRVKFLELKSVLTLL